MTHDFDTDPPPWRIDRICRMLRGEWDWYYGEREFGGEPFIFAHTTFYDGYWSGMWIGRLNISCHWW